MHEPVISASNHEQHRMPLRGRVFHLGIWIWMLAWCLSILVHQTFIVNLKGWWGMQFFMSFGSLGVMIDSYSTGGFNHIHLEEPSFLWSKPFLDHLRQYPEASVGLLGRVGWSGHGCYHTMAFPIAGFLWLWLILGWLDFKVFRWAEFQRNGRMFGRVTILTALPLVILVGDYKQRRASQTADCTLNVRNIQQAVRGHSGVRAMNIGSKIDWGEIIGPGRYLASYARKCPGGEFYRLSPVVPSIGVLAAECPNHEHQRRVMAMGTSDW